jgi:Co/Zn/Cd efflux system component
MGKKEKTVHKKFHRLLGSLSAPGMTEWRNIHEKKETAHWRDMDEMHRVMHNFPGFIKALIIELTDRPFTFDEILDYLERFPQFERKLKRKGNLESVREELKTHIDGVVEQHVFSIDKNGKYHLTPRGLEMASHMQEAIPVFIGNVFSPRMVSIATIVVHILLTAIKCGFGALFQSAGLLSDGIDNGVDTVSSVLVWLGIRFNRERLSSFLVIIMMFVSVVGVAIASVNKILKPGPVMEGPVVLIVSGVCGVLMLFLSIYQYVTGKRNSSFTIMCQSVDSRNHFLISLLVCFGIILSIIAERREAFWLYHADAGASIIIGCLILKSAVELLIKVLKPEGEPEDVGHFMQRSRERMKRRSLFSWISTVLKENPLTREKLDLLFTEKYCKAVPKIFTLSGFGYNPQNCEDLHRYLEYFLKKEKLVLDGDTYKLSG